MGVLVITSVVTIVLYTNSIINPLNTFTMGNLTEKIVAIQSTLKAPKSQYNSFGKYKYRNQEDILEAVKPLLQEQGLVMTISDNIIEVAGIPVINAVVSVTDGTEEASVMAQAGIDINRKGMDIAQSFGASSSYARKYALNGMFLIDDTKDADSTNNHSKSKGKTLTNDIKTKMKEAVAAGQADKVEKALAGYDVSESVKQEILG